MRHCLSFSNGIQHLYSLQSYKKLRCVDNDINCLSHLNYFSSHGNTVSSFFRHWHGVGSSNPTPWRRTPWIFYKVNAMAGDDMAHFVARATATMLLIWNISISIWARNIISIHIYFIHTDTLLHFTRNNKISYILLPICSYHDHVSITQNKNICHQPLMYSLSVTQGARASAITLLTQFSQSSSVSARHWIEQSRQSSLYHITRVFCYHHYISLLKTIPSIYHPPLSYLTIINSDTTDVQSNDIKDNHANFHNLSY